MISVNDFKTGLTIEMDNEIWQVLDFQHVKPGKGSAFVRSKLRNVRKGNIQEKTFRAGEKVSKAVVETLKYQYLYSMGDEHVFMETDTYEQTTLPASVLENELNYLQENMIVQLMMYNGEVIGVQLPNSVELEVTQTDPGIRGDTVSGASKPATLTTGLVVNVPLFINVGDKLVIDTRTGDYVSRA